MAPDDDYIDPLGDEAAELEARFRALEEEADMAELRRKAGMPPENAPTPETNAPPAGPDPLADMKAALDSDEPLETYLLVICPGCQGRNRVSMTKVRTGEPVCGRCKEALAAPRT